MLYVTRHGETEYNVQGRYAGSVDVPLTERGIAQAKELAESLKEIEFDAIITTPLLRARHTTEIVCGTLDMDYIIYEDFAEISMGVYEGLTREEAQAMYPEMWARLSSRPADDGPDGGETKRAFCDRVDRGLERLAREYGGKTVLIVCHAFAACAINRKIRRLSYEEMHSFRMDNCEVVSYIV